MFGTWILSIRASDFIRYFFLFCTTKRAVKECFFSLLLFYLVFSGIYFCLRQWTYTIDIVLSIEYWVFSDNNWIPLRDAFHFSSLLFPFSLPFPFISAVRSFFYGLRHFGVFIPSLTKQWTPDWFMQMHFSLFD